MNLIPEDYFQYIRQLRFLRLVGTALLSFLALSVLISLGLKYKADEYHKEIVVLEKQKAISSQQRSQLQSLEKNYQKLDEKLVILEKLRGGALAKDMFVNIDRALTGKDVWFKNWTFVRAGSKTNEPAKGVNTGYFIVIPEAERINKKQQEAWKIQMHMEIEGQATNHGALSSFVRRVLQQPQIADVKILSTRKQVSIDNVVVDFKLIVMVNSGATNS